MNYSLKEVTGKSTSTHISELIATEAKDSLNNSERSITDIAYVLSFGYKTYFNSKKK